MIIATTPSKPKLSHLLNTNQLYCLLAYSLVLILVVFYVFFFCFVSLLIVVALNLKLATINCHGIGERAKRTALFAELKKMNVQAFCLQETFSKPQNEQKWEMEWTAGQAIFNSGINTQKVDSGSAILLNQPLIKFGPCSKDSEGRIISTEIHCDTFKVQL